MKFIDFICMRVYKILKLATPICHTLFRSSGLFLVICFSILNEKQIYLRFILRFLLLFFFTTTFLSISFLFSYCCCFYFFLVFVWIFFWLCCCVYTFVIHVLTKIFIFIFSVFNNNVRCTFLFI